MNKKPTITLIILFVLAISGCGKTGILRHDLSSWQNITVNSTNLNFDIPVGIKINEFNWNDYQTPGKEKGCSFEIHKVVPGGMIESHHIINFMIRRFSKDEWESYVEILNYGTSKLPPQPNSKHLVINHRLLRSEDDRYITYSKDIVTQNDFIRIKAYLTKGSDIKNEAIDENTIVKIIESMKPKKNEVLGSAYIIPTKPFCGRAADVDVLPEIIR